MATIFMLTMVAAVSVAMVFAARWDDGERFEPADMDPPPDEGGSEPEVEEDPKGIRPLERVPQPVAGGSGSTEEHGGEERRGVDVQLLFVRPARDGFCLDCVLQEPLPFQGGELPAGLPVVLSVRPPRHDLLGAAVAGILEGWAAEGRVIRLEFVGRMSPKRIRLEGETSRVQLDLVDAPKLS